MSSAKVSAARRGGQGQLSSVFIAKHPVVTFYILALAFSWAIGVPLAFQVQGWADLHLPLALHYLISFGPLFAAIIVTALNHGRTGLAEMWSRMTRWRVGTWPFLFAILSPIVLFSIGALAARFSNGRWIGIGTLGQINYLPDLGIGALILWVLTFGFGEETGWRGFALPRLQNGRGALSATVILWAMWLAWHIPAFFYLDTYMNLPPAILPMFGLGVLAGAIVLTWLYNSANGSILMLALWHGMFDFFSAAKVSDGTIAAIMSTVIMVWAVVVLIVYKPAHLSRAPRQVM
jgi:membrane protease YdiL (CAAX protease family)